MKSFQSLIVVLAALFMISAPVVTGSSSEVVTQKQKQNQSQLDSKDKRKLFDFLGLHIGPKPPPPAHPPTGDGSSGGGSSSSSGGGGGSSSGGSSSSSGGGGGSSGGSGSGSGGSSGSGGTNGRTATANGADGSNMNAKAKKSLALMLSMAAFAGVIIAAIAIPRRKVANTNDHALKGSINKRIQLFSNLAKHAPTRPPRRDETGRYINADAIV